MIDRKLLQILVCPVCKGPLKQRVAEHELICRPCRMGFPVQDDIPVLLVEQARLLEPEEEYPS